eukprot:7646387-Alexandrium_andersonii.AAC.1
MCIRDSSWPEGGATSAAASARLAMARQTLPKHEPRRSATAAVAGNTGAAQRDCAALHCDHHRLRTSL